MNNPDLAKTSEDWINEYYTSYFEGYPITFIKNKFTGEVHINADEAVRAMDIAGDFNEFLGTDRGLDLINQWKKEHPDIPFFGGAVKINNQSN